MIIKFSVKNFKCIKEEITLSFEANNSTELEDYYIIEPKKGLRLLKLGLIYGANASGKTTILDALDFLRHIAIKSFNDKSRTFNLTPFLFDEKTPKENTKFTLEFFQNNTKYLYIIELNKNYIANEYLYFYCPKKALVYKRTTLPESQFTQIKFGSKIKIKEEIKIALTTNTLWNDTVIAGYNKTNFESQQLQDVFSWFKTKLEPIIRPNTDLSEYITNKIISDEIAKINMLKILKKADFGISNILIDKIRIKVDDDFIKKLTTLKVSENDIRVLRDKKIINTVKLELQHNEKFSLPYELESAGTKRYYQLSGLLLLMLKQKLIFPIDELESSLHPDLLKHFLLTFLVNSKKTQLIATTHHRELLLEKDILRNDVIWFTEKKEDSSTDLYSLADFHSSVVRKTKSIYNMYKIGKLGAVPNLGDYYLDIDNEKDD